MKFGYFTLTDNPVGYGAARRNPNQLLRCHAHPLAPDQVWMVWVNHSVGNSRPRPSAMAFS